MCNIFIGINGHLLKRWNKLVCKYTGVNKISILSYDFGHTELYVWNIILASFKEDRNNVLSNLVLHYEFHNGGEGVEATHSVVIAFFVNCVLVDDHWNKLGHYPVLFEFFREFFCLFDALISNAGCGVGEISHKN